MRNLLQGKYGAKPATCSPPDKTFPSVHGTSNAAAQLSARPPHWCRAEPWTAEAERCPHEGCGCCDASGPATSYRRCAGVLVGTIGKQIEKVDPFPRPSLRACIEPPCSSTRSFAMVKPKPSP